MSATCGAKGLPQGTVEKETSPFAISNVLMLSDISFPMLAALHIVFPNLAASIYAPVISQNSQQ